MENLQNKTSNKVKIKKAIAEAQEKDENKRNGIKYIESRHDKKKNVMKVWLTDNL